MFGSKTVRWKIKTPLLTALVSRAALITDKDGEYDKTKRSQVDWNLKIRSGVLLN